MIREKVARWVRAHFAVVADVNRATTEPDASVIYNHHQADVVVSTWMGARLYIHLIDQLPKVRDLKAILRTNSRCSIGTLFLVDKSLLPANDAPLKMQDWWEGLTALNETFFYVYSMRDDQLIITQAHFLQTNTRDEVRLWYLPEFNIEKVTVRRRTVPNGTVKGTWHVADIASPNYKRRMNDERAQQRFHYRTKYTQDIPPRNGRHQVANNTHDRRLQQYYKLIGVEITATEKEIKTAFRQMALKVHPDVSALPRQEATERIKRLNEAYEYIKDYHGWV